MSDRSKDWLKQARRDLDQAKDSAEKERFEWTCFAAHQAAEKSIKALHLHHNQEAWGHSAAKLLGELPEHCAVPAELVEKAKVLDNFYIPARYPNGHPEGAPFEHYGTIQGKQAVEYAGAILEYVDSQMAR